jgi:two-component system chemotaxis response regulator CheB
MIHGKVKVLIVEDSPTARALLVHLLSADPQIDVLGTAANAVEALAFLDNQKPDVITVDINMPGMDGFELTRRIMISRPVPIIIMSATWRMDETTTILKALETGAVAFLDKPRGADGQSRQVRELLETIKTMAAVKLVRRRATAATANPKTGAAPPVTTAATPRSPPPEIRLVAIGASTGGPLVLQAILSRLAKGFPVPVLIVLHIAEGFLPGFVGWLEETTHFPCRIAQQDDRPLPGHAYLAPDNFHMGLGMDGRIELCRGEPHEGLRPSVAHLFQSVAGLFGAQVAAVLLTGMGRDGAQELKLLHDRGALTMAQDQQSSVVFGMPGEAVRLHAATYVLDPERIAAMLNWAVANESRLAPYPRSFQTGADRER